MKSNKKNRKVAVVTLLIVLPLVAVISLLIQGCSKNTRSSDSGTEIAPPPPPPPPPPQAAVTATADEPYQEVDVMPVFKGGDAELINFIMKNTKYPEVAKKLGTQGKVLVRFAVEKDGSVDRISVLEAVDLELDQEALRVVSSLPPFEKPGIKDGKPVAVWYVIPISFALK